MRVHRGDRCRLPTRSVACREQLDSRQPPSDTIGLRTVEERDCSTYGSKIGRPRRPAPFIAPESTQARVEPFLLAAKIKPRRTEKQGATGGIIYPRVMLSCRCNN